MVSIVQDKMRKLANTVEMASLDTELIKADKVRVSCVWEEEEGGRTG